MRLSISHDRFGLLVPFMELWHLPGSPDSIILYRSLVEALGEKTWHEGSTESSTAPPPTATFARVEARLFTPTCSI